MTDSGKVAAFAAELRRRVTGDVRTDRYSRIFYSTDASIYQVMPLGVFLPRRVEELQAAVELAAQYELPVLPRTSGTSLAGQAVNEALVIDMSRHLDRVLEVNEAERWVRVQPGVVLDELNAQLAPLGLKYGPDPASSDRAAMGGIVSNNSTGAHSILYGMTADHVRAASVILSDGSQAQFGPMSEAELAQVRRQNGLFGSIVRGMVDLTANVDNQATIQAGTPRHWRRCGGYNLDRFIPQDGLNFRQTQEPAFNLAKLVCGAEGTLAVMSDITLNLVPTPRRKALAIAHFDSLRTALEAVPIILEVEPAAVELLDHLGLTLCREVPEYARLLATFVEGEPYCVLIIEFYGESEAELQAKMDQLARHLGQNQAGHVALTPALHPELQANIWKVRKVGLGLLMSVKGDHKPIPFIEDAAVPVEHLADYVDQVERYCHDLGTEVAYYAHASAGCLHVRPLINTKLATEVAKLPDITSFSVELLHGYGGSLSSEHGDGRARSWINEHFFGPDLYALYGQVKGLFDPHNLLNPGNVVAAGPMTTNLRYGADYQVIAVDTMLDFSPELGFDRAVEMCNGAGVCRKKTAGTMCPSFMVTREEEHSTRGRANALRAALSGHLPAEALTDERMYRVMELCIECKACKAECPSSVDMAKLKYEFLAHYQAKHGVPLRARLFGDIHRLSRWGSGRLAPLANWSINNSLIRAAMQRFLGISAARPLPPFARQPFTTWYKERATPVRHDRPQVVLFNDTFNTYNYPQVAQAATRVLESGGYQVLLAGQGCCGRPMISKGLLDQARRAAQEMVARLAPLAARGLPIIGLEPSCLLTLRDDYGALLPHDERVEQVAASALTFEEFVAQAAAVGDLRLDFEGPPRHILLHGHCHQKALVGSEPSKAALALPPDYTVEEVDSGCCGMAGSFGYEAEHIDLSVRMAERRLLPAVGAADAATLIAAAGVSCRQQVTFGSSRQAHHPAEILAAALPGSSLELE